MAVWVKVRFSVQGLGFRLQALRHSGWAPFAPRNRLGNEFVLAAPLFPGVSQTAMHVALWGLEGHIFLAGPVK